MDITILRSLAHAAAIGLITACMVTLFLAWRYGWSIRISHLPLALGMLALFDFWFLFLLLSLREIGIVPREIMVPLLAVLELGAVTLGWSWFIFAVKANFKFALHRAVESTPGI